MAGNRQMVQRADLAASHLQGPSTFTIQLDHLLSLVAPVNHITSPERHSFVPTARPVRTAHAATSARLPMPSFMRMLETCTAAVLGEM